MPRAVTLRFRSDGPLKAHVSFEITELDKYGLVRPDLRGLVVWLADSNGHLLKSMGRVNRDAHSEFPMSAKDTEVFRRIGAMPRVFSFVLRQADMFREQDGIMFDQRINFAPLSNDVVASFLSFSEVKPAFLVGQQPIITGLDPIWREVVAETDPNKTELLLRSKNEEQFKLEPPVRGLL